MASPPIDRRALFAVPLVAVLALVALRLVELRTIAHLLYSPELMDLGSLAWHVDHGGLKHDGTLAGFIATYQYNHFDQGTLLVQGLNWLLSRVLGGSGFVFHLVALCFEALTVAVVAWLGAKLVGWRGLLGVMPLLLAPAFVVAWQLMPYGNHTEFQWIPLALGGVWLVAGDEGSRPRWPVLGALLALGVLLYRMNAAAGLACVAAALTLPAQQRRPAMLWIVGGGAVGLGLIAAMFSMWPEAAVGDAGLIPRLGTQVGAGIDLAFLGAPRNHLGGWPWRIGLVVWAGLGAFSGLRAARRRPFAVYALTLAAGALAAPILLSGVRSEYLLTGVYALLALGVVGLAATERPLARASAACALLLAVSGLADARWLADPGTWSQTTGFDGPLLHFELGVQDPDADEIPHYVAVLDGEPRSRHLGIATATHTEPLCAMQPARLDPGPLRPADEDRCPGWSPGSLATLWRRLEAGVWQPTATQRRDVGAGAWIACQRDLRCVEAALRGLPDEAVASIMVGAQAEAIRQASR